MKRIPWLIVLTALVLAGCEVKPVPPPAKGVDSSGTTDDATTDGGATTDGATTDGATTDGATTDGATTDGGDDTTDPGAADGATTDDGAASGSAAQAATVALSPENTTIQFVGTHAPPKDPDPRTGTFGSFRGTAKLNGGQLESISVEIDTTTLKAEFGEKLTNHLKSPDFFDVNQYPAAKFETTGIESEDGATVTIKGNLTLHGVTKEISFPATVSTDDGLTLNSEFTIDRTEFGMDYGADSVEKEVSMTVSVQAAK